MKGIVLAGGSGTRLNPLTLATSKQLLPVYDKPMIYYPISTLMLAGIRNILIITAPQESDQFKRLLQDGSQWGVNFTYLVQEKPEGIAQAFSIAAPEIQKEKTALVLGDNIFYGAGLGFALSRLRFDSGALIFAHKVSEPSHYGVLEFDSSGKVIGIEEKPTHPKSRYVVPGLYFYDQQVVDIANRLKPSARGELEITDLNKFYLDQGQLSVEKLDRGTAWLDTGTAETLLAASEFVRVVQQRQGLLIGSPEEIAWRHGWITEQELLKQANRYEKSSYGKYLIELLTKN